MLSYAIRWVGEAREHAESQGPIDAAGFKAVIDGFPWAGQHRQWSQRQGGPLPALILSDGATQRELWISALSDDTSADFQVHVVALRKRKTLFGKEKLDKEVWTVDVETRIHLDALIDLMFAAQHEAMDRTVASLAQSWVED